MPLLFEKENNNQLATSVVDLPNYLWIGDTLINKTDMMPDGSYDCLLYTSTYPHTYGRTNLSHKFEYVRYDNYNLSIGHFNDSNKVYYIDPYDSNICYYTVCCDAEHSLIRYNLKENKIESLYKDSTIYSKMQILHIDKAYIYITYMTNTKVYVFKFKKDNVYTYAHISSLTLVNITDARGYITIVERTENYVEFIITLSDRSKNNCECSIFKYYYDSHILEKILLNSFYHPTRCCPYKINDDTIIAFMDKKLYYVNFKKNTKSEIPIKDISDTIISVINDTGEYNTPSGTTYIYNYCVVSIKYYKKNDVEYLVINVINGNNNRHFIGVLESGQFIVHNVLDFDATSLYWISHEKILLFHKNEIRIYTINYENKSFNLIYQMTSGSDGSSEFITAGIDDSNNIWVIEHVSTLTRYVGQRLYMISSNYASQINMTALDEINYDGSPINTELLISVANDFDELLNRDVSIQLSGPAEFEGGFTSKIVQCVSSGSISVPFIVNGITSDVNIIAKLLK